MGTVVLRRREDGTPRFQAQICLKQDQRAYRESRTFRTWQEASDWLTHREAELARGYCALEPTLADAIESEFSLTYRAIGRTRTQMLRAIQAGPLGPMSCSHVGTKEITAWAEGLRDVRSPATVLGYLWTLEGVFVIGSALGFRLQKGAVRSAIALGRFRGILAPSVKRTRRPSLAELGSLMGYFEPGPSGSRSSLPMQHLIAFAIFSTRRLSEITRLRWEDFEPMCSRVLVRGMKNAGSERGNNVWTVLVPEAVAIIEAQPKEGSVIFPFNARSISTAFRRATNSQGIEDLRFHDMRHDGVSRLFEMGWDIPEVMGVSGHRMWSGVQRYTHLEGQGDKFADWPWLERIGIREIPNGDALREEQARRKRYEGMPSGFNFRRGSRRWT